MIFSLNKEETLLFFIKNRFNFLILLVILIGIIITFLSFSYFSTQKKAKVSAKIAIAFVYLEEEKKDKALLYFQDVFNSSKNLYGVISAAGVLKSLEQDSTFNQKAQNVLSIIKNYKSPKFIKMFLLSSFLENASHFDSNSVKSKDLEKLKKFATNIGEPFTQSVQSIELNLAK